MKRVQEVCDAARRLLSGQHTSPDGPIALHIPDVILADVYLLLCETSCVGPLVVLRSADYLREWDVWEGALDMLDAYGGGKVLPLSVLALLGLFEQDEDLRFDAHVRLVQLHNNNTIRPLEHEVLLALYHDAEGGHERRRS